MTLLTVDGSVLIEPMVLEPSVETAVDPVTVEPVATVKPVVIVETAVDPVTVEPVVTVETVVIVGIVTVGLLVDEPAEPMTVVVKPDEDSVVEPASGSAVVGPPVVRKFETVAAVEPTVDSVEELVTVISELVDVVVISSVTTESVFGFDFVVVSKLVVMPSLLVLSVTKIVVAVSKLVVVLTVLESLVVSPPVDDWPVLLKKVPELVVASIITDPAVTE